MLQELAQARPDEDERRWADDAARLYEQGWTIRQVAQKFDCGYGTMRRILRKYATLRSRGGTTKALSVVRGGEETAE
ncbi:helix-turn-helix domain-containing protein [Actinomadura sp. DC4]|nr:helix-turn-helix domain-containing protein [Actinomadura sp. DC4]MDN3354630.1 helix-turn-helix domain-containing protein [Actinomadura sp. DC4]